MISPSVSVASCQARDRAADHARPDDRDPVADEGRGIPQHVHGGLDRAGQHGTPCGHTFGYECHGRLGHDERGLVREQAEHRVASQSSGPLLHDADVQVSVLDRAREIAFLKGRAHALVLAGGHFTTEDDRLGAAADAGVEGPHEHLAGPRITNLFGSEHPGSGALHPECRRVGHHCPLPD